MRGNSTKTSKFRLVEGLRTTAATQPLLCEVAWEVCQQLGGIYTVLRSKAESIGRHWGDRYILVGPYNPERTEVEFHELPPEGPFAEVIGMLKAQGLGVHYGQWLITGRPRVILLDPWSVGERLGQIKYFFWKSHHIDLPPNDRMIDEVIAFGWVLQEFLKALHRQFAGDRPIIAHFHEWMAAVAIPELRRIKLPVVTVFTTHATLLGRYLAPTDPWLYDHLPTINWEQEAARFNIGTQVRIERAAAHGAHVFTTVSKVTAYECEHLLHRKPDVILPNGINKERFLVLHEFQNLHRLYKQKINDFVIGHFFPSYTFDLDKTLYFFTSGRFEYRNKGFDLTIEALARLNHRMQKLGLDRTIVFFLITKKDYHTINPEAMRNRAIMEEIRHTCQAMQQQVGERLFMATAMGETPPLDDLVDDHWMLRLRQMRRAWRTARLPSVVTHNLMDDASDPVLCQLRSCNLINRREDPVKIVYHPDFITTTNPLLTMDYDQFVRGCHLGIFPSAYEPWGYTPLECIARGLPAVTSDLSGFGAYLQEQMPDHRSAGLLVLPRRFTSPEKSIEDLTEWMLSFACQDRRARIAQRNHVEAMAPQFDWENLIQHYQEAYRMALERLED